MKEIILNKKEEQVRSNICYTMLQCYGKRKVFNLIKVHAEVRSVKKTSVCLRQERKMKKKTKKKKKKMKKNKKEQNQRQAAK